MTNLILLKINKNQNNNSKTFIWTSIKIIFTIFMVIKKIKLYYNYKIKYK